MGPGRRVACGWGRGPDAGRLKAAMAALEVAGGARPDPVGSEDPAEIRAGWEAVERQTREGEELLRMIGGLGIR